MSVLKPAAAYLAGSSAPEARRAVATLSRRAGLP